MAHGAILCFKKFKCWNHSDSHIVLFKTQITQRQEFICIFANENKDSMSQGDTDKATFEFSYPPAIKYLEKMKIPVLVTYGTKDESAPFNDFLYAETIRRGNRNFTFKAYIGTDHNFFPLTVDNKPNYDIFNWDNVANDWLKWLNEN